MDGELMDLAAAFDDNPADELAGEKGGEQPVPKEKKAAPVTQEVVEEEEVDENGEPELDEEGNPVVPEESDDVDADLDLDLEGQEGEGDADEIPKDKQVKIVVDGQEVTKTFAQLIEAAQKAEGAEKRFLEASTIRKDAEAKLAVLPEREKQLGQVLEYYIAQSTQFMEQKQPDWEKLIAEDPQKYLSERLAWEKRQSEANQAKQIHAELQRRNAEQEQASKAARVASEREQLLKVIPEWQDPVKAAEGSRAVGKYLADAGIPAEMLGDIDHHQVLVIARKAMLYDAAIAKQAAARKPGAKSVQRPQQTVRVERPGAATPVATNASRNMAAREKANRAFKAAPSVDTLASLFE